MEWWGNETSYPAATRPYPSYIQDYLKRVTVADAAAGDTMGLETEVIDAIAVCLQSLVTDGILGVSGGVLSQSASLIKAACFMQGARTLSGALVPLAADMPAPTNVGPFVTGDYSRRTGLGSSPNANKYLNSNYSWPSDFSLQNNAHLAVYASAPGSGAFAGAGSDVEFLLLSGNCRFFNGTTDSFTTPVTPSFYAVNRASSSSYTARVNSTTIPITRNSTNVGQGVPVLIYRRGLTAATPAYSAFRLLFYSIGSALDLAILDARITALSNAIQAAIPP